MADNRARGRSNTGRKRVGLGDLRVLVHRHCYHTAPVPQPPPRPIGTPPLQPDHHEAIHRSARAPSRNATAPRFGPPIQPHRARTIPQPGHLRADPTRPVDTSETAFGNPHRELVAYNESGVSELASRRGPGARTASGGAEVRPEGPREGPRSRKPSQLCAVGLVGGLGFARFKRGHLTSAARTTQHVPPPDRHEKCRSRNPIRLPWVGSQPACLPSQEGCLQEQIRTRTREHAAERRIR
jgi:hypothetical protein